MVCYETWADICYSDLSISILKHSYTLFVLFLISWCIVDVLEITGPVKIEGLFQIPDYPIVGSIFQVWNNPSLVYMKWWKKYQASMFQVRLGNTRMVIVNSYEDVKNIWIGNSTCLKSRPIQHTFHDIVSSSQGFTVGSTPYCPSYQIKKKLVSQLVNQKSLNSIESYIERDSRYVLKNIIENNRELNCAPSTNCYIAQNRLPDIDLKRDLQYYVLRTALHITYGCVIDCYKIDRKFSDEIIEVERQIIHLRSPVSNLKDYFPFLRRFPISYTIPNVLRERRDKYLARLSKNVSARSSFKSQSVGKSFMGKVMINNPSGITSQEIKSVCLTMISAGLDNTPLNINHLMGHLSKGKRGRKLQARAYKEILTLYNQSLKDAWNGVARNMECHFVIALLQETLRYFSVLPLSLPRVTTKSFTYKNVTIPEGTTIFMNTYAANHDSDVFEEPFKFMPERWLDRHNQIIPKQLISHYTFGAGARMCSGNHLAMKEMYVLVCRMILLFKIKEPNDSNYAMQLDPFENNENPRSTSFEPRCFKVKLVPRVGGGLDDLYREVLN